MKHAIRTAIAFVLASLYLCSGADAKIVTFQIPNSQGIWPTAMNDKGEVTGRYEDRIYRTHGFLAAPGGAVTTFDVPVPMRDRRSVGAVENTTPVGISGDGAITGSYSMGIVGGGFVRAASGAFAAFTVGAQTSPLGANRKGWSVGQYWRSDENAFQPFLRDPSGATVEFSVPGALGGVFATVVNRSRTIAGSVGVQGGVQGFFRPAHGTAALFGDPHHGVGVTGINDAGTIVGTFFDQTSVFDQTFVAFVRTSDGIITTFLGPNGSTAAQAWGINKSGTIAGTFVDGSYTQHGFIRAADGTYTTFDIDGASAIEVRAINDKGAIAGDAWKDGAYVGFAGKP